MFNLIGLGLRDGDLSIRGLDRLRESEIVYGEFYTNLNSYNLKKLEKEIGKKIIILDRTAVESLEFLKDAKKRTISLLISGDPLTATTHFEIISQCKKDQINFEIIHSCSIFTLVAETGLSLYKFGRTTTLPKKDPNYSYPYSPYEVIKFNLENKIHSLVLLDIGLNAKDALEILEFLDDKNLLQKKKIIILCNLGNPNQKILYDFFENLKKRNFGELPHSIVIPGKLNHKEEEYLDLID